MKQLAKLLVKHPFIQGSAIVIFGNLFANFFNFLFNLFMSRNLSVADYGILASMTTLIGLPAFLIAAIGPMVMRFAGDYFARNRLDLVRSLYIKITKFLIIIVCLVLLVYLVFVSQIGEFFQIRDKNLLFITIIIIIISVAALVNYVFIQAKLAFKFHVSAIILTSVLKLIIGVILVYLGYSVGGAVFAFLAAGLVAYLYTFLPLRFIFDRTVKNPQINTKELLNYAVPSALALFGLTALISTDIILVKHYFPPVQAGIYAGLALVGKVIFYVAAPIGSVMFPIIVQKHSKQEKTTNTFIMAVIMVLVLSISLVVFYYLFPKFTIIFFLKKSEYLRVANLLGLFGIFTTLYSLAVILANFYLSIKKTKVYLPLMAAALGQIILIILYHDTFYHVIIISLIVTFLLDIMLLLYYPYATKK